MKLGLKETLRGVAVCLCAAVFAALPAVAEDAPSAPKNDVGPGGLRQPGGMPSGMGGKGSGGPGKFEQMKKLCEETPDAPQCQQMKLRKERREARIEFCKSNPDDENCKRMEARRAQMKKCRENPNDAECAALRQERLDKIAKFKEQCQANPNSPICQRLKAFKEHGGRRGRAGPEGMGAPDAGNPVGAPGPGSAK